MKKLLLSLCFILIFHKILISQNDDSYQINNLLEKSVYYINKNGDSVDHYSKIAYKKAEEVGDYNSMVNAVLHRIKSKIKTGRLLKAKVLCDSVLHLTKLYNLDNKEPMVSIVRGNVYQAMGFYSEALEIFIEVDKRLRLEGYEREDMDLYYYMAMIYFDFGDYEKGYLYLTKSLNMVQKIGNDADAFSIYYLYINTSSDADTILKYMRLADSIITINPRLSYEEVALRNSQAIYNKAAGNLDEAKSLYNNAIKIASDNNFNEYLTILLNNFAYVLMAESSFDSAKMFLDTALLLSIKDNCIENESEIYDSYCDYYKKIGDYENAFKYAGLFIEKDAQYREQQQAQKSLYLTAVFETEQKEKEILRQKNEIAHLWLILLGIITILAVSIGLIVYYKQKVSLGKSRVEAMEKGKSLEIANAIIEGQDAERKRLAMDLHDGLGARLGALRFVFDGFFKSHKKYDEVSESIQQIHQNIRDLSHRMLPTQLEKHGLIKAISDMISSINDTGRFKVHLDTNIDSRLSEKLEVNIYFMIYELINNATRHSKGSTIFVQLYEHEDTLNLSVEDDGGGYNYDRTNQGMGLKNINRRVEYLGGKITIESADLETITMIEIPVSKND